MSNDTHMLLRTPLSAAEVRAALVHDPALANLGLVDFPVQGEVGSDWINLIVRPWREDDHDLIEDGFETATVRVKFIPGWGTEGWEAEQRALAAILRLVPGDVCLANQDAAGPNLLRLDGVVYINPDGFRPENLTDFGYVPERLVVGIPAGAAETAAAE